MPAKTDPTKLEKAVAMYLQCANATTVEASTGVSRSVLYRALQARGIKPSDVVEKLGKHGKGVKLRCACCGSPDIIAEALD